MKRSKGTPFLFDENIFDEDAPGGVRTKQKIVEDPLEFTQKQAEAIRQKAFQEGVEAGIAQANENKNKMIIQIVSNLEAHIKNIEAQEKERKELYERECLHLCFHALSKAFPTFNKHHGFEELKAVILDTLTKYNTPETLQIELSGIVLAEIESAMSDNASSNGTSLSFTENNSLGDHEFHISWSTGGIIYNRNDVLDKIMEILEETLAQKGINVHDEIQAPEQEPDTNSNDQSDGSGEN